MDFEPTPEQKAFQQEVERLAEGGGPAAEILGRLRGTGLMGMLAPREEGGGGRDRVGYALALMAIARRSIEAGALLFVNNSLYVHALLSHGSDEQKKRYLRPCCAGEGAGTAPEGYPFEDPGDIRMNAVRSGDGWVLHGGQPLKGDGVFPSHAVIPAITGEGPEVSLFVLDLGKTAGLRLTSEKGGAGRERVMLFAEAASLPDAALLGTRGKGAAFMAESQPHLWIGVSAFAVGIGRSVLRRAVEHSLARKRLGKPVFSSAAVQWALVDAATELDAAEFLVLRAAWLADMKKPFEKEAAMAKLYASDAALKAGLSGGRVMGEDGLKDDAAWDPIADAKRCGIEYGNNLTLKGYITGRLVRELKGT